MIYKKLRLFNVVMAVFLLSSVHNLFAQSSAMKVAKRFMQYLNNYQAKQLSRVTTDDFQLTRTYSEITQDKAAFISEYIAECKLYNGKFVVLNKMLDADTVSFLVEDASDYLKYLGVSYPKWQVRLIVSPQNRIESMVIDTTVDYQNYQRNIIDKINQFNQWLKVTYPNDNNQSQTSNHQLELKRLQEYADHGK